MRLPVLRATSRSSSSPSSDSRSERPSRSLNHLIGPKRRAGRRRRRGARASRTSPGSRSRSRATFRFGVSFYLVAMLFILFDIEVVFLYPVGVILKSADSVFVLVELVIFVVPAAGRARLRLAQGSAGLEVERRKIRALAPLEQPRTPEELRIRQLRAREMLRGDLEGDDLERLRRGAGRHDDAREDAQLGARELDVPAHLRARLLRDRGADRDGRSPATTSPASAPRRCAPRRARPT